MKRLTGLVVLAVLLGFGTGTVSFGADPKPAQTVKGDLLKIEGEFYVVKDAAGKEVRLHVNKETKLEGAPKAGDKIEAQVTAEGHANSIKAAK